MRKLVLLETLASGQVVTLPLESLQVFTARPGARYSVIDEDSGKIPEGLVLVRNGDSLTVEVDEQPVVRIDDFYNDNDATAATYSVDGSAVPAEGLLISGAEGDGVADGAVVWQAEASEGGVSGWTWAGLLAGGALIATAAAAAGNDSDGDGSGDAANGYALTVSATAGHFTSDALVEVFDQNGNLLTDGQLDPETGQVRFTIDNTYSGPLLINVSDTNGTEGDYLDEATNVSTSLGEPLRAMVMADGTSNIQLTVSPLTELAVRQAGIDQTDPSLTADDVAMNDEIGVLFGVEDITGNVVTVLDGDYDAGDGLSAAEVYGNVLAMLSGVDGTTGDIDATLDQLQAGISTTDDGDLAFSQEVVDLLSAGIDTFEAGVNGTAADLNDAFIEPPVIAAATNGLNAAEKSGGVDVEVDGAATGDEVIISWGVQTYSHIVQAGDIDGDGLVTVTVPESVVDGGGDGSIEVRSQVNDGERSPAVIIHVDTTAPVITSGGAATAINENTGAGQVVYTAASDDTSDVAYTLKGTNDDALFSIDADSGEVTLTGNPDYETRSSYSFTVVATDAAGNSGEQAVTLNVNDLDDTPPVISDVSIPDAAMNVGDTVTVSITVDDDGGDTYTNLSGTIGGFALSNLSRTDSTTYTAEFTVTEGGTDVAAGSDIPVSLSLEDSAGNTSSTYTTAIGQTNDPIDANSPILDSMSPADGAAAVGSTDNLTLTFSEAVSAGTGNLLIRLASDDTTVETIDITSGQVTGWGTDTLTVNPAGTFASDTAYYVQFPSGAVLDAAGNPAAGITDTMTWNFSTPDSVAPTVQSFSSTTADGSYAAGDTINITATTDEAIQAGGTLTVILDTGDSVVLTAAANGTTLAGTYTVGAGDASSDLTVASFTIGSVQDLAGNAMVSTSLPAGNNIADNGAIVVDTTAPVISDVSIPDAAMHVGDTVTVSITVDDDGGDTYTNLSGTIGGFALSNLSRTDSTTYTAEFTVTEGGTDVAAGSDIPVSLSLEDSVGNTSNTYTTAISQASDAIDANSPVISDVSIPDAAMHVGDTVTVSITVDDDGGDTYTNLSGTIGGFALSNLSRTDSTTYTAEFTVTEGGTDVAAGSDIPVSLSLEDSVGNTSNTYTTAISQASDAIDANSPVISDVSIPDAAMNVGDTVTVSITADEAGLSLDSGTVNGVAVTGFTDNGGGSYSATYTVAEGDTDRAAGADIPVSIVLSDAAGNTSNTYTTAISQASDAIDANSPVISDVSIPDVAMNVGDTVTVSITADEAGLSLDSGTVNGVAVTGFTDNGGGSYSATYTVAEGDTDRAAGADIPVSIVLSDAAGNTSNTYTTAISQASDAIDANSPVISDVSIPDVAMNVGDTVTVSITADEAGLSLDSGTVNGVAVTGFTDNGGGSYSATYTVAEGDTDRAAGADIPVSIVLSDAAGNASNTYTTAISQASDAIDANSPVISDVSIPDVAMNVGDTVTVSITADEAGLSLDSGTVNGVAVTGFTDNGGGSYSATYTVAEGNTDRAAGADIPVSIVLSDAAGNTSNTYTTAISQASDAIDANSPTLSASTPGDDDTGVSLDSTITLTFDEDIALGSTGTITITDGSDVHSIDVGSHAGQLSVSGDTLTIDPSSDLANNGATYHVEISSGAIQDLAGNDYAGIDDSTTLNFDTGSSADNTVVVFDLINGNSSDHSGRNFDADTTYSIYIMVDSASNVLYTDSHGGDSGATWGQWHWASNLGADDTVTLVGNGSDVLGFNSGSIAVTNASANVIDWRTTGTNAAAMLTAWLYYRFYNSATSSVSLWTTTNVSRVPGNVSYITTMPVSILTTQGLA